MSISYRKLSIDTIIYSVFPQIPKFANVLLLPFTTPYLTSLDFAIYGTVLAFIGGLEILRSLGLDVILLNSFYKEPNTYKNSWGKVAGIISIWSLFLTAITGVIIYNILPGSLRGVEKWTVVFCVSIPSLFMPGLTKISSYFYQFKEDPKPIVMRSMAIGFLAIGINYYSIAVLRLGYLGWFYSMLITGIISPLTYIFPIWIKERILPIYRISMRELKEMLLISLPMLPHNYSHYFLNFSDRLLLNFFSTPNSAVGLYNIGYNIPYNFRLITNSVDKVIAPTFHKILSKKEDLGDIKNIVFGLSAMYLIVAFLGAIWMKEVFHILVRNEELSKAYEIAIIILFSFVLRPLYNGGQSFLFYEEKNRKLWLVTFSSGVLNVVLNFILIPHYGIWAAAINTLICISFSHFGIFFLDDLRKSIFIDFRIASWLCCTMLSLFIAWQLRDANFYLKCLSTFLACGLGVSFLRRHVKKAWS